MDNTEDIKIFILFVLIVDLIGVLIYIAKGNYVGIFNCLAWAVLSGVVLLNFNKIFLK